MNKFCKRNRKQTFYSIKVNSIFFFKSEFESSVFVYVVTTIERLHAPLSFVVIYVGEYVIGLCVFSSETDRYIQNKSKTLHEFTKWNEVVLKQLAESEWAIRIFILMSSEKLSKRFSIRITQYLTDIASVWIWTYSSFDWYFDITLKRVYIWTPNTLLLPL